MGKKASWRGDVTLEAKDGWILDFDEAEGCGTGKCDWMPGLALEGKWAAAWRGWVSRLEGAMFEGLEAMLGVRV